MDIYIYINKENWWRNETWRLMDDPTKKNFRPCKMIWGREENIQCTDKIVRIPRRSTVDFPPGKWLVLDKFRDLLCYSWKMLNLQLSRFPYCSGSRVARSHLCEMWCPEVDTSLLAPVLFCFCSSFGLLRWEIAGAEHHTWQGPAIRSISFRT